ncbi:hypothetical protein CTAYLR_004431 [Chrysophaeum taylorii]|uniref:Plastid lipid-associated protein/fibrillin conserved domain-containing protein n=1 Tax=Chrysophaeum taylorii TaxID=2483200 RepID=A0AAD7XHR2_9STRA|nr:hypothetical protein CTAYLR_004431 [Chrysophaeum taylorii]
MIWLIASLAAALRPGADVTVRRRATEVIDVEAVDEISDVSETKGALLAAMAATARGEALGASATKAKVATLVSELEKLNRRPTSVEEIAGRWSLAYSDTQIFRSSPFWMAGRATCATPREAQRYDLFCDLHRAATAVGDIGAVRQLIDPRAKRLVSEFETIVAAYPQRVGGSLPLTITGSIVSTADIEDDGDDDDDDEAGVITLLMDTVEVKGSNIPGIRAALDAGLKLESRRLADLLPFDTPRPRFETTFVDDTLRVSRDVPDGHLFVYVKESDDPTPTDYSRVPADLGIPRLFQAAIDLLAP